MHSLIHPHAHVRTHARTHAPTRPPHALQTPRRTVRSWSMSRVTHVKPSGRLRLSLSTCFGPSMGPAGSVGFSSARVRKSDARSGLATRQSSQLLVPRRGTGCVCQNLCSLLFGSAAAARRAMVAITSRSTRGSERAELCSSRAAAATVASSAAGTAGGTGAAAAALSVCADLDFFFFFFFFFFSAAAWPSAVVPAAAGVVSSSSEWDSSCIRVRALFMLANHTYKESTQFAAIFTHAATKGQRANLDFNVLLMFRHAEDWF
jgi:hypothetical protein